ncbi:hypothetical protein [Spongiactinospora sp. TRM90649]|uniref:hypothetical protein n=1 Tax=Spongiactinospora sp. TRM90649 TaxID=3031114 RepID=UPI0023F947EA|nr:hypothetical protein [Spongiactinospora sp. TRM90649]MDF5756613.1 hypothetical protein [Spongiactinospora sp. TRM90649]
MTARDPASRHVGRCPACTKVRYPSRRAARAAARRLYPGTNMRAYPCGGYWHLARNTPWRIHGVAAYAITTRS